jgi:hypothetical protein
MEDRDAYRVCCERLERNDPSLVEVSVPVFLRCTKPLFSFYLPRSNFVSSLRLDLSKNSTICATFWII